MLLADSSTHISVIIGSIKTNLDIVEMVTFCITQTLAPFSYNICFRGSDLYFNPNSTPLAIIHNRITEIQAQGVKVLTVAFA